MTLKESLNHDYKGLSVSAHQSNLQYLNDYLKQIEIGYPANNLYYSNWRVKNSPMQKLDKSLITDYPVIVHTGYNKCASYYVNSVGDVTMTNIIQQDFDKSFKLGKKHLTYNYNSYRYLCAIAVAMIITKYEVKSLFTDHIIFSCLATLYYYYTVYSGSQYTFDKFAVSSAIASMLGTDITVFVNIAEKYNFRYNENAVRTRKDVSRKKPQTLEDLTQCFDDNCTTQTAKKEAIMKWWCCGQATARKYMQQFGLTESKFVRTDYKEIHEHIDIVSDAVCEVCEDVRDVCEEMTDVVTEKIDSLNNTVIDTADQITTIQNNSEKIIALISGIDTSIGMATKELLTTIKTDLRDTIINLQKQIATQSQIIQEQSLELEKLRNKVTPTVVYDNGLTIGPDATIQPVTKQQREQVSNSSNMRVATAEETAQILKYLETKN